jgi:Cu+-exporting ATPase
MHPEVQETKAGACPKCGMALESRGIVQSSDWQYQTLLIRFWICLSLSIPIFILSMTAGHLYPPYSNVLQLLLALPVVSWGAYPFFQKAWDSVRFFSPNMFTLIAIGIGTAFCYSTVVTLAPHIIPSVADRTNVYFESAAVITTLVLLGQILEFKARSHTKSAIRHLLSLTPKTAQLVNDSGADKEVSIAAISVGDKLRVRPGEKIPVDGIIIEGVTEIDESTMTGEMLPIYKSKNNFAIAGTINGLGSFVMEAKQVGNATLIAQIAKAVCEA